jgi:hypothetical protein
LTEFESIRSVELGMEGWEAMCICDDSNQESGSKISRG